MSTYGKLIAVCYGVALVFLALLGGALKAVTGLSLWKFVRYTREELLLALGTGSSETVMPRMMQKLRAAGCRDDAVGLVLPTGYSFNLDGASIYLSIGTLFIAQAIGVDLSLGQQITVVLVLMLTSKGMAGVPGSAFLALSATASALGVIPLGRGRPAARRRPDHGFDAGGYQPARQLRRGLRGLPLGGRTGPGDGEEGPQRRTS